MTKTITPANNIVAELAADTVAAVVGYNFAIADADAGTTSANISYCRY